jgi:imidazolonepropionase-like amidohydrolase
LPAPGGRLRGGRRAKLEAIHIATADGAQYLGELDRIGTIASGKPTAW